MKILDVALHNDSFQRGTGQMLPTARRCMYAAQMLSSPRLMEPVYLVDITCSEEALDEVDRCMERRRGEIFEETHRDGTVIRFLKVCCLFGCLDLCERARARERENPVVVWHAGTCTYLPVAGAFDFSF